MKKVTKILTPLAVLALFGAVGTSILAFLVVLLNSLGLEGWQSYVYFQKLNLPALSIALPIGGMILFAVILLGSFSETEEKVESIAGESRSDHVVVESCSQVADRLKAA